MTCVFFKQLAEIQDACLDCENHLECFPMDPEIKQFISSAKNSDAQNVDTSKKGVFSEGIHT
jgi:hypothetical protein